MTEWHVVDGPDWPDGQKRVQLLRKDGGIDEGTLVLDDFFPADGDEVPCFIAVLDDGRRVSIWDYEGWRLV